MYGKTLQVLRHAPIVWVFLFALSACSTEIDPPQDSGDGNGVVSDGGSNTNTAVLAITATTPSDYRWTKLTSDAELFIDRAFIYQNIPSSLQGLDVLKTANADKMTTENTFLTFNVNIPADVYVAYDSRLLTTLPAWLSDWTDIGITIVASDTTRKIFSKQFTAGTVALGGNAGISESSMYTVMVIDPQGTTIVPATSVATPGAVNDSGVVDVTETLNISVLQNDTGLEDTPITISIVKQPSTGSVVIESDNTITYTPGSTGSYDFGYRITDNDGQSSSATVTVVVTCGTCANDVNLKLNWIANPSSEMLSGYRLYFRVNNNSATNLLADIPNSQLGFDAANPSMVYNAGADMGLMVGDQVCISIRAYNNGGASNASSEVCEMI